MQDKLYIKVCVQEKKHNLALNNTGIYLVAISPSQALEQMGDQN